MLCSDFKESDQWAITKNESMRLRSPRDAGELLMFSRRVTLRFTLGVRRRVGFSAYLLTIPCVVLGGMSAIIFILPPERPDRHGIGEHKSGDNHNNGWWFAIIYLLASSTKIILSSGSLFHHIFSIPLLFFLLLSIMTSGIGSWWLSFPVMQLYTKQVPGMLKTLLLWIMRMWVCNQGS